jgi:starch synthase
VQRRVDSPTAAIPSICCLADNAAARLRVTSGGILPAVAIRVAFIAAECEPWAKTGGLADVVDALARALGQIGGGGVAGVGGRDAGDELDGLVDVFIPRYRGMREPEGQRGVPLTIPDPLVAGRSISLRLLVAETHGYRLHLVDHPPAFDRDGMYGTPTTDHPDNAWRFALLNRAALEYLRGAPTRGERAPDVIHIHDWHTGPAALLRETSMASDPVVRNAALVLTVHNLAYHGWTAADRVPDLGLGVGPAAWPTLPGANADGIDLLRAAIDLSDLVTTVSPGFAAEALGPEMGMGLDGDLRAKGDRFLGILNGLDTDLWDPATDAALPARYSAADRAGKAACRRGLLAELGMDRDDARPVLSMVGRLDRQKGFDLLAEAAPALVARGIRLAVLGSGNHEVVAPLRDFAASAAGRGRIALMERFDRDLARRLYAGPDGFLMPSRFEPCGTGQMVALRYGTPPIVHAVGGLRDTVIDVDANPSTGTGFVFESMTADALIDACDRFARRFTAGGSGWDALLDRGMAVDFDWRSSSAPMYLAAYRRAIDARRDVS